MPQYEDVGDGNLGPMTTLKIAKPRGKLADFTCERAVLDTGSPWTYIPKTVQEDLGLPVIRKMTVTGVEGRSKTIDVCEADLTLTGPEFGRREFLTHHVCIYELSVVLIGRDLLGHFVVVFDGPAQAWRVI